MGNRRALVLIFLANLISGIAQGITTIAIPVYFIYELGDGEMWFQSFVIVWFLGLFWRLYAGVLVDGFRRKDVFLGTNFFAGLIVLSVAALGFAIENAWIEDQAMPPILPILVFATTLFSHFIHFPNLYAFIQEITEVNQYSKWTRYVEIFGQITSMAAAFVGGILAKGVNTGTAGEADMLGQMLPSVSIDRWQLHELFALDGATYIVSFIIILFIRYRGKRSTAVGPNQTIDPESQSVMGSLQIGWKYLRRNRVVLSFGLIGSTNFIIFTALIWTTVPLYVSNQLHADEFVAFLSEFFHGIGALFCALILRWLFRDVSIPAATAIFIAITALMLGLAAVSDDVSIFFVVCLMIGFSNAGGRIYRILYLFNKVPNEFIGRVNSILTIPQTLLTGFFVLIFSDAFTPEPFFFVGNNVVYAYWALAGFALLMLLLLIPIYRKAL